MGRRITLDELPEAINDILEEYQDMGIRGTHMVVEKIAKSGAKEVNAAASGAVGGNRYKRSWTAEVRKSRLDAEATIYSRIPGLPHLLEHGHAGSNGRRGASAHPHIKGVEEKLTKNFEKEIEVAWQQ